MIKNFFIILSILILLTGCTGYRKYIHNSDENSIIVTEIISVDEQLDFPEESTMYNKISDITDNQTTEINSDTEEISDLIKNELLNFNHIIHFSRKVDEKIISDICDSLTVENPELYWITGYSLTSDGYSTEIEFNIINDFAVEKIKEQSAAVEKKY